MDASSAASRRGRDEEKRGLPEGGGVDFLEWLPDNLVIDILSRLGNARHVQRAAVTSRRLRRLARHVNTLRFDETLLCTDTEWEKQEIEYRVTWMLALAAPGSLKSLSLNAGGSRGLTDGSVAGWVVGARVDLESLEILDQGYQDFASGDLNHRLRAASSCPQLRHLKLTSYLKQGLVAATIGKCEGGFKLLESLCLQAVSLSHTFLELLLGMCPKLRDLVAQAKVYGESLELKSRSLESLVLELQNLDEEEVTSLDLRVTMPLLKRLETRHLKGALTVKAPLEALTLSRCLEVRCDLGTNDTLRSLALPTDHWPCEKGKVWNRWSLEFFLSLNIVVNFTSLRHLTLPFFSLRTGADAFNIPDEALQQLVDCWKGLHELTLTASFLRAARLEDHGRVLKAMEGLPFTNLKSLTLRQDIDAEVEDIRCLRVLLRKASALQKLTVDADGKVDDFKLSGAYLSELFNLQALKFPIAFLVKLPKSLQDMELYYNVGYF